MPSAPKSILLFGGTFDPVHNGHVAMLHAAVDALSPSLTIIIPVGQPWQKEGATHASAEHRIALLKLAFPNFIIDAREVNRQGPTYTVETLRDLTKEFPTYQLHWLIGGDSFAKLDSWREPEAIAALTQFAVVRRANEAITPPRLMCRYAEIIATPPPVSSSMIRQRLEKQQSITDFVPRAISDYIQKTQIY